MWSLWKKGNGFIEGTELDGFLREFVASANPTEVNSEVSHFIIFHLSARISYTCAITHIKYIYLCEKLYQVLTSSFIGIYKRYKKNWNNNDKNICFTYQMRFIGRHIIDSENKIWNIKGGGSNLVYEDASLASHDHMRFYLRIFT